MEISAYFRYVRISFRPAIKSALLQRYVTSVPRRSPRLCGCGISAAIARLLRHTPASCDQPCPTASTRNPAKPVTSQSPAPPPPIRKVGSTQVSQLLSLSMRHAESKVSPCSAFGKVRTDKRHWSFPTHYAFRVQLNLPLFPMKMSHQPDKELIP